MSVNTATHRDGGWALFLDVDGTLLEIAETPADVDVPARLKQLLNELRGHLDGAMALISGRSLENLDRLFAPLRLCASGVHGCERRGASGVIVRPELDTHRLAEVRGELGLLVHERDGLLLEDKGYGLAVHFRRVPELHSFVESAMRRMLDRAGPEFVLQPGKCVVELRPRAWSKGSSITAFMQELPFADRTPIYIGDDVTDESAFAAVNSLGGISIHVGDATATLAQRRLSGVAEVMRWLENLAMRDLAARAT